MKQILLTNNRLWIAILLGSILIPSIIYSKVIFCLEIFIFLAIAYIEWQNMALEKNAKILVENELINQDSNQFINQRSDQMHNTNYIEHAKLKRDWIFYRKLFIWLIMPGFLSLIILRLLLDYRYTLVYMIHIWMVDSLALCFGKVIGGPKLSPAISPNKTLSGFSLGIILSATISTLINKYFKILDLSNVFVYYCILGLFAQLSDLLLSYFKRKFSIKDFIYNEKPILSSHGGVLDRFDSIVLSAPIALLVSIFCSPMIILTSIILSPINFIISIFTG